MQSPIRSWRRAFLSLLVLSVALVPVACGGDDDATETEGEAAADTPTQVTALLSFPPGNAWLPMLVAENQGYFEDEGLDLTFEATDGSGFVTQQVIAGNADFGWAGASSDLIAYEKVPSLRALACNHEQNIFSINVLADSGIDSVEQLDGKRLGITEKGGGEEPMVNAVIEENDLDLEIVPLGEAAPGIIHALEGGQVDAFAGGITDVVTLEAGGMDFNDITPEEYDPMPGDCLISTSDVISDTENQETAAAMIRAWMKGAYFAIANVDAAVDIACTAIPEECKDREGFTKPFAERIVRIIQPVDTSLPPTAIDPAGWNENADVLKSSGVLGSDLDIEDLIASPEGQEVASMAYADQEEIKKAAEEDAAAYTEGAS